MTCKINDIRNTSALYSIFLLMTFLLVACGSNVGVGDGGGGGGADTTAPTVSKTTPNSGIAITASDPIEITFNETMDTTSLVLGGDMATESNGGTISTSTKPVSSFSFQIRATEDPAPIRARLAPSATDTMPTTTTTTTNLPPSTTFNILTIIPQTAWSFGIDRTLTIDAKDISGNPLETLNLTYTIVEGIVYVSIPENGGDDSQPGIKEAPKATIPEGINAAVVFSPGAVLVSQGTYLVDSGLANPSHIILMEEISIYGGYSIDFSQRDSVENTTIIQDINQRVGASIPPNRAIDAGKGITEATMVAGLTIQGGGGSSSSGIFIDDGAFPTVQDNIIDGGGGIESYGIYNTFSSPNILNNNINGGRGGPSFGESYGIYNLYSSPIIQNNTIDGGGTKVSNDSYGIINSASSPIIRNNTIKGGSGGSTSTGILNADSSPIIQNNTIDGGKISSSSSYGIHNIQVSSPIIENNIIFNSSFCIHDFFVITPTKSIKNNDLFRCPNILLGVHFRDGEVNGLPKLTGNVSVDPVFVDRAGGDFHLTSSSPTEVTQGGLDLSTSPNPFSTDKDGAPRTDPRSMGAYELD